MENFRLYPKVDTQPFLEELEKAIEEKTLDLAINAHTLRPLGAKAHKDSSWQALRNNFFEFKNERDIFVQTHPLVDSFPKLYSFLKSFARQQQSLLRRAVIVGLHAEGEVAPHIDNGFYYATTRRFHLVLVSPDGSEFHSGDETAIFRERELWWFDNKKMHSVKNLSDHLRIHVIFDLLPVENLSFKNRIKLHVLEFLFENVSAEVRKSLPRSRWLYVPISVPNSTNPPRT